MTSAKIRIHTLDDMRRILIPRALRSQLGWQVGDTLSGFADINRNCVTISKAQYGDLEIDGLGRVALDKLYHNILDWATETSFAVYIKNDTIVITPPQMLP